MKRRLSVWSLQQTVKVAEGHFAKQRNGLNKRLAGNVMIFGQEDFSDEVNSAILQLAASYPFGYHIVQRYVRAVVQSAKPPKSGLFIGVVYQPSTAAGRLPWPANRFAAILVWMALTTRFIRGFRLPSSPRSELIRLRSELRAMHCLNCHPRYFPHQLQQMARARSRQRFWFCLK